MSLFVTDVFCFDVFRLFCTIVNCRSRSTKVRLFQSRCVCVRVWERGRDSEGGGLGGGCARENIHSSLTPRCVVCYMKTRLTFANCCRACARLNLSQESRTQSKSISATVECWTSWHVTFLFNTSPSPPPRGGWGRRGHNKMFALQVKFRQCPPIFRFLVLVCDHRQKNIFQYAACCEENCRLLPIFWDSQKHWDQHSNYVSFWRFWYSVPFGVSICDKITSDTVSPSNLRGNLYRKWDKAGRPQALPTFFLFFGVASTQLNHWTKWVVSTHPARWTTAKSCHTYEWGMSCKWIPGATSRAADKWMSPVTHGHRRHVTHEWVFSHV